MSQSGGRGVPLSASARAALQASSLQAASSSGDLFRTGGGFARPRMTAAPGGGQPPTPSVRKRRVPNGDGPGEGLDTTMPSFEDSDEEDEYRERLLRDEDKDGEDEDEGAGGDHEQEEDEEDEEDDDQEEAFDPLNMADLTGNTEASPAARRSKSFEAFYERRPSGNTEQRRGPFRFCVSRAAYERAVGGEPLEHEDLVPGPFAPLKGHNVHNYPENPNQERLACSNCANYWTNFRFHSGHSGRGAGSTDVWTCNCGSTLRGVPNRCLLCPICSADEKLMAVLKHSCKMSDGRYRTGHYRPNFTVDALFEKDKVLKGKELDATGAKGHMKCEKCGWDPNALCTCPLCNHLCSANTFEVDESKQSKAAEALNKRKMKLKAAIEWQESKKKFGNVPPQLRNSLAGAHANSKSRAFQTAEQNCRRAWGIPRGGHAAEGGYGGHGAEWGYGGRGPYPSDTPGPWSGGQHHHYTTPRGDSGRSQVVPPSAAAASSSSSSSAHGNPDSRTVERVRKTLDRLLDGTKSEIQAGTAPAFPFAAMDVQKRRELYGKIKSLVVDIKVTLWDDGGEADKVASILTTLSQTGIDAKIKP
mmetsp:Transcript_107694/g.313445  ORF Transcript_107694/g.313445 Transcript_107694/m.313445 type:complete len:587 (-) Transcript_107694:258-2018(-)